MVFTAENVETYTRKSTTATTNGSKQWRQFPFTRITRISRHIRTKTETEIETNLEIKKERQTQLLGVTTIKSVFLTLRARVCVCVLAIYISPFVISCFSISLALFALYTTQMCVLSELILMCELYMHTHFV